MEKIQDCAFSLSKSTNISPAVFNYLQPSEECTDQEPLGGILSDCKHGWLALGPRICAIDLRSGLKVAAKSFESSVSSNTSVTNVVELPTPLTDNSIQLVISVQCEDLTGLICVLHVNGSQVLRCIQTDVVITKLAVCDQIPACEPVGEMPLSYFDGMIVAGAKGGEIIVFDMNRTGLIQALKDISHGYSDQIHDETNAGNLVFLPLNAIQQIEHQRKFALENGDHLALLINEGSFTTDQYMFLNPDGTVRLKAKRDNNIRVSSLNYIPQLGSVAVGYNFGAFQLWNLLTLELEFTSQVNIDCLPVSHFAFQEPCDDPRAFCYLWAIFSVTDRLDEDGFPLAVMYSLTYRGKRMLSDVRCLYQEFTMASIRFQIELSSLDVPNLTGGRCIACHAYTVSSLQGDEGEDNVLNLCQLVWECWGDDANAVPHYGMLLFDLDQWYKDQMPDTQQLCSNVFMSTTRCDISQCLLCDARIEPASLAPYLHATRLDHHLCPNSLHYNCIWLTTSEAHILNTIGIQRQIISSIEQTGPTALLTPGRLYDVCVSAGLVPLFGDAYSTTSDQEEQRRYLLSVALEAGLLGFLKRCAHDWATGSHVGVTLTFLIDWCWKRALELKENAKELTAPLFTSASLPDKNVINCLENSVQQLTLLTSLLDAVLTKCCNLIVPDALSEIEEKHKGIDTVSLYFRVVQWFVRVGLLPDRASRHSLSYPRDHLVDEYAKRRIKLHRLQDNIVDEDAGNKSCSLLYIDQLIDEEFGGDRIHDMWRRAGSDWNGLYPPPSIYSLLRLYLLPDIATEHKHSLVLYLLVDYSMVYDEVSYESVKRRLMQFPTMFGLSITAIRATQAFWHLDHRKFDFALDQLQCLTGNTLSDWQHHVVLSSLLAQKKTQAALQYLHVRKPAPIQNIRDCYSPPNNKVNDHDKLNDSRSACSLYLARQLVLEALDVTRACVQNATSTEEKTRILTEFFKGCRNTGQLSKMLQVSLLPFEEEVFIKYLEKCNESQTSDILIMYYLQQGRYLEAQQYNAKFKMTKRPRDMTTSVESLLEGLDREGARDTIVEIMCASLPKIANTVAQCAYNDKDFDAPVLTLNPMSVFVPMTTSPQAKNFTYKSTFIQDTIENASETWINKPKLKRGLKRALNIEDTPFICTPKLMKAKSIFSYDEASEATPPKRRKFDAGTPKTPNTPQSAMKGSDAMMSREMTSLLEMPELESPDYKNFGRAETPHSILKTRRYGSVVRDTASPMSFGYLRDEEDEMLETASNHTHFSDSTNKHLRFTIPRDGTESTPSPVAVHREQSESPTKLSEMDVTSDSCFTYKSRAMEDANPMESPPKKLAVGVKPRKSYKDIVTARLSFHNISSSSLSDEPNASVESIADHPVTLINPTYRRSKSPAFKLSESSQSREFGQKSPVFIREDSIIEIQEETNRSNESATSIAERFTTPIRGRKPIRDLAADVNRSRSLSKTPERPDSPIVTPTQVLRVTRSRTPEISPRAAALPSIAEQPKQEFDSEPHPVSTTISAVRSIRSRSRTPERLIIAKGSPTLDVIAESPVKLAETKLVSPVKKRTRSRSRTPERTEKTVIESPTLEMIAESPAKSSEEEDRLSSVRRTTRARSKTPERMEITQNVPSALSDSPSITLETSALSPIKRSLRARSRTPERQVKPAKGAHDMELITDSPATSSESPVASPLKRGLRNRSRTPEQQVKPTKDAHAMEVITESSATSSESPVSSPLKRGLRGRSKTPERVDKVGIVVPAFDRIEESPVKSSESEASSPVKRSTRSRSRTPEVEIIPDQITPQSQRSLRSRSKTPEKLLSPKVGPSAKNKKSLSRLVLEANTFAKTKQIITETEEQTSPETSESISQETSEVINQEQSVKSIGQKNDETETQQSESICQKKDETEGQQSESIGEKKDETEAQDKEHVSCTPKKKDQMSNFMDVTFSPIMNKSILQSPNECVVIRDIITPEPPKSEQKSLPAFTFNETNFGKSVLGSYESSGVEATSSFDEKSKAPEQITEKNVVTDGEINLLKWPSVTDMLGKSVLRSYESSAVDSSQSITEDKDIVIETVKEIIVTEKVEEMEMVDPLTDSMFQKSVLRDVSSLMTSDDSEMKDEDWGRKDVAAQKEKETIGEIEREISEIEGDMSDASQVGSLESDGDSDTDSVEEQEGSDESEQTESSDDANASAEELENDVISIIDSDSEQFECSSSDRLQIDENSSQSGRQSSNYVDVLKLSEDNQLFKGFQADDTKKNDTVKTKLLQFIEETEASKKGEEKLDGADQKDMEMVSVHEGENVAETSKETDPLLQGTGDSMMTDDNSVHESDLKLNYPNEKDDHNKTECEQVETTSAEIKDKEPEVISQKEPEFISQKEPEFISQKELSEIISREEKMDSTDARATIESAQPLTDIQSEEQSVTTPAEESTKAEAQTPSRTSEVSVKTSEAVELESAKSEADIDKSKPATRKRTKTIQSIEGDELCANTTRGRSKTPTKSATSETKKSKELDKLNESRDKSIIESSLMETPRRTRTRSKNSDDSTENSSKYSGDAKPARKARKSLAVKPELSAIPETITEEGQKSEDTMMSEYTKTARLTRHQKALLESWLQPKSPGRRPASRSSVVSTASHVSAGASNDDEDRMSDSASVTNRDGSPVSESQYQSSPESTVEEVRIRARPSRAVSEARMAPKPSRVRKSLSLDVANTSLVESPGVSRGRRVSFTKACEALHAPTKGRLSSIDVKKGEADSQPASPAESETSSVIQTRRTRKLSTQSSNTKEEQETSPAASEASSMTPSRRTRNSNKKKDGEQPPSPSASETSSVTPSRRTRKASTQSNTSAVSKNVELEVQPPSPTVSETSSVTPSRRTRKASTQSNASAMTKKKDAEQPPSPSASETASVTPSRRTRKASTQSNTSAVSKKGDSDKLSPAESEMSSVTPSRRTRKASTQSNTSQANSETGKRTRASAAEEN